MLRLTILVPALVGGLAWFSPAPAAGLCAAAKEAVGSRVCVESANGVVIADDSSQAQLLLADAEGGVVRFRTRFNRAPGHYAVIETTDGNVGGGTLTALKTAGFKAVLPYLSPKGFDLQIEASVRRSVEAQTVGMAAEAREAVFQEAMGKVKAKRAGASGGPKSGVIAHELGHMWYVAAFWPGAEDKFDHYGGAGPDWMDETAAVLMEPESLAGARATQFADRYRKLRASGLLATAPDNALVDLPGFFASTHPGAERGRALLAAMKKDGPDARPKEGVMIRASSGPEADKFAEAAIHYYLQATVAGEYLADRTGDPAIFARIGVAFGKGETMAQWLANKEPKGKLPRNLTALQADWLAWLNQRFPAEPAKSGA